MKEVLLDTNFGRHEVVKCDRCTARWTLDVARSKGWLLVDDGADADLCERCKPQQPLSNLPMGRKRR